LVDLVGALTYLQRRYAECYTFLFEPQPHHAFFGATPELLIATQGKHFTTMGLAGSAKRGATPEEDARLADALLNSAKDRYEHALVVAAVQQRLEPLAEALDIPDTPSVYTLSNIHHLYTPIHGTLQEANGVLPLVETLHPTPALGGAPRELALAFISAAETVTRGWYAAPVGWIDHKLDGAFGVAIRSAIAQRQRAWLYAGAGIVAESEAQKEWEETGWKFRPIQEALGVI
jgi:isochorismate synthase